MIGGVMQDIGGRVSRGHYTMKAVGEVAKYLIQERGEGFRCPCYAGAWARSKAWPID